MMTVRHRQFNAHTDYETISDFLTQLYELGNRDGNCFQACWENSYTHPYTDIQDLASIGIWETGQEIVGVAFFDMFRFDVFLSVRPDFTHLYPEMLTYAEQHLTGTDEAGKSFIKIFEAEFHHEYSSLLAGRGFEPLPRFDRPMSRFIILENFPVPELPDGYRFKSLAEDNDLRKVDRVLHRGFNHEGEPPADGIEGRKRMQSGPNYRPDLTMVVEAPNGDFVTFCGMRYDRTHKFGYIEPVATDPDYRRRGLGRANVLESIRRCGMAGATVAYVGTDKPFYLSFGFKTLFKYRCWIKTL